MAAGQLAPNHLGAAIALGTAAILLIGEVRPRSQPGRFLPVLLGAGLVILRLTIGATDPGWLERPPDGATRTLAVILQVVGTLLVIADLGISISAVYFVSKGEIKPGAEKPRIERRHGF